jgi:hypothetical protein
VCIFTCFVVAQEASVVVRGGKVDVKALLELKEWSKKEKQWEARCAAAEKGRAEALAERDSALIENAELKGQFNSTYDYLNASRSALTALRVQHKELETVSGSPLPLSLCFIHGPVCVCVCLCVLCVFGCRNGVPRVKRRFSTRARARILALKSSNSRTK